MFNRLVGSTKRLQHTSKTHPGLGHVGFDPYSGSKQLSGLGIATLPHHKPAKSMNSVKVIGLYLQYGLKHVFRFFNPALLDMRVRVIKEGPSARRPLPAKEIFEHTEPRQPDRGISNLASTNEASADIFARSCYDWRGRLLRAASRPQIEHKPMNHEPFPAEAVRLCDEGYALLEACQFDDASAALQLARALAPAFPLVHYRLGLLFSDTGRPADAVNALEVAIRLQPDNARAHNNRGSALQLLGRNVEAEAAFRAAIALAPDLEVPHVNLGKLLELCGRPFDAIEVYKQAIARGLDAPVFKHYLAAATGQVTERAPVSYVRDMFDNFAPLFDERLRELKYDAPRELAALIRSNTAGPIDILDLGCGTGQCGMALGSIGRRLVGIDLSEKMLVHARAAGIYDELVATDIQDWIAGAAAASFDLVIAGDVFIYLGSLDDLFREVGRLMRPGGCFAFSTEECTDRDYKLLPSGRFAQADAYIRRLSDAKFKVVVAQPTVIRMESGIPLAGRLYLLRRL